MRRSLRWLAAALLASLPAVPASALVLEVQGRFVLDVAGQIIQPGGGQGGTLESTFDVTVNGAGGALGDRIDSIQFPPAAFGTDGFLLDVTDPVAAPIEGLLATLANAAGNLVRAGQSGKLAGPLGLSGQTRVCLFADCNAAFVPANLTVPVNVAGVGGATFVSSFVNITVIGAPWTTGTVNIGDANNPNVTPSIENGFAHGPASGTTSTASPSGVVSLVTPLFISTSIPGATSIVPGFAFLNLRITPEPGSLLLLGSGVAGLALLGRRRIRS